MIYVMIYFLDRHVQKLKTKNTKNAKKKRIFVVNWSTNYHLVFPMHSLMEIVQIALKFLLKNVFMHLLTSKNW
jgi:hypothetical protein